MKLRRLRWPRAARCPPLGPALGVLLQGIDFEMHDRGVLLAFETKERNASTSTAKPCAGLHRHRCTEVGEEPLQRLRGFDARSFTGPRLGEGAHRHHARPAAPFGHGAPGAGLTEPILNHATTKPNHQPEHSSSTDLERMYPKVRHFMTMNFTGVRAQTDHIINAGVNGLVPGGSTGEFASGAAAERKVPNCAYIEAAAGFVV